MFILTHSGFEEFNEGLEDNLVAESEVICFCVFTFCVNDLAAELKGSQYFLLSILLFVYASNSALKF